MSQRLREDLMAIRDAHPAEQREKLAAFLYNLGSMADGIEGRRGRNAIDPEEVADMLDEAQGRVKTMKDTGVLQPEEAGKVSGMLDAMVEAARERAAVTLQTTAENAPRVVDRNGV